MDQHIVWTNHHFARLGPLDLAIPFGEIGTGSKPIVSITALMHGNEHAGIRALEDLLFKYLPTKALSGTVRFFPIANPLATLFFRRASPFDLIDLNRIGIGKTNDELSEKLAYSLYTIMQDSAYIINLHEFEALAPLTCVYTNSGSASIRRKTLRAVLHFNPDVIWSLHHLTISGGSMVESFDMAATKEGTASFAVEFPRNDLMTNGYISRFSHGIGEVLKLAGVVNGKVAPIQAMDAINKSSYRTLTMGIWKPCVGIMEMVDKDQKIGTLHELPFFNESEYKSQIRGMIINIRPEEVVKANDILFSIGTPDAALRNEIVELV